METFAERDGEYLVSILRGNSQENNKVSRPAISLSSRPA